MKINGNRFDLSEIEHTLQQQCHCRNPVVVWLGDTGELVIVLERTDSLINSEREFLLNYLPSYAIPSRLVRLERFPLLPSNKIDRRQIIQSMKTSSDEENRSFIGAFDEIGIPKANLRQSFFAAGGSSLNAILLVAKLHQAGFDHLTVEDLINAQRLHEILCQPRTNKPGKGSFFRNSTGYEVITPLENIDKHEAFQLITESFVEMGETDLLVHHHHPVFKLECKQQWIALLDHYWLDYIQGHLSFGIYDNEQQLIGIAISNDLDTEPDIDLNLVPRLAPIFTMIEHGERELLKRTRTVTMTLQPLLHNFIVAVSGKVQVEDRPRLMYSIERQILDIASTKGYAAVLTTNVGSVARHISEFVLKYDYHLQIRTREHLDAYGSPVFPHATDQHIMTVSIKVLN